MAGKKEKKDRYIILGKHILIHTKAATMYNLSHKRGNIRSPP